MTTRDEAIRVAGAVLAQVLADIDAKSPRQAAEDACRGRPGANVAEVEDLIRAERGLKPKHRGAVATGAGPGTMGR